ncbi:M28 family metallopeptidase [Mariniflexile sp. AS56]|uniref:M28 family metallopeptidase n=1 Tax=Mariniflexile sp. AS56 TaxID=3063957 RepID=UPI0026F1F605|nr:M28 family peptidase [Mariniflexile sp. AS56]MDO7170799.1 M20/M25/M40 family metallo-hydrolase [Mariniflexile sp. AS56]
MKKSVFLLVLIIVMGCKSSTVIINNTDSSQNVIPKPSKGDVIMTSSSKASSNKLATSEELKEIVSFLASDDLKGRDTGSEGIEKAAVYIETIFRKNNIKPYYKTYRDSFNLKGMHAYNIVGFIEGNDETLKNEIVIIGAHYDHIGSAKKVGDDTIANGANDNAAGTSGVLEIAEYFAETRTNKRSILIALFSAEEKGLKGSEHLAKKLKAENIDLYTMLNFEMIGVPFVGRPYDAFLTGYDLSNMSAKINEYTNSNLTGFSEVSKKYDLFTHSDNYAFYKEFKLPCQTFSSCDLSNYDYYHHVDDEADKLDYNHMASLINKVIPAIETICNTPTKEITMNHE